MPNKKQLCNILNTLNIGKVWLSALKKPFAAKQMAFFVDKIHQIKQLTPFLEQLLFAIQNIALHCNNKCL